MDQYRKDLDQLVIVCTNAFCNEPIIVPNMLDSSIKENKVFVCHVCWCGMKITAELEDYVKQTRCYS